MNEIVCNLHTGFHNDRNNVLQVWRINFYCASELNEIVSVKIKCLVSYWWIII